MHIGQEALTNTLSYAHADNFETQLTCNARELRLEFRTTATDSTVKRWTRRFWSRRHARTRRGNGRRIANRERARQGTKVALVLPLTGDSRS